MTQTQTTTHSFAAMADRNYVVLDGARICAVFSRRKNEDDVIIQTETNTSSLQNAGTTAMGRLCDGAIERSTVTQRSASNRIHD
jgi:hypothetical protein